MAGPRIVAELDRSRRVVLAGPTGAGRQTLAELVDRTGAGEDDHVTQFEALTAAARASR